MFIIYLYVFMYVHMHVCIYMYAKKKIDICDYNVNVSSKNPEHPLSHRICLVNNCLCLPMIMHYWIRTLLSRSVLKQICLVGCWAEQRTWTQASTTGSAEEKGYRETAVTVEPDGEVLGLSMKHKWRRGPIRLAQRREYPRHPKKGVLFRLYWTS